MHEAWLPPSPGAPPCCRLDRGVPPRGCTDASHPERWLTPTLGSQHVTAWWGLPLCPEPCPTPGAAGTLG